MTDNELCYGSVTSGGRSGELTCNYSVAPNLNGRYPCFSRESMVDFYVSAMKTNFFAASCEFHNVIAVYPSFLSVMSTL